MLLWIGAILCYIAYTIQASAMEEVPGDNVSRNLDYHNIYIYIYYTNNNRVYLRRHHR